MLYYLVVFVVLLGVELLYFRVADYFNIIDKPNERSSHTRITLRGGGIVFYVGALVYFVADRGNCIDRGRLFPPEGRSGRDFERNDAAAGGGFRASDRRLRVADGAARNGFCRRGDAVCYCQRGFARNLRRQTEQKVGAGVLCRFCPHVRAEHCHAVIFS